MAVMIPSALSPEIKSNAERHIFKWFENAPGTEEWIVLHSLGITNHKRVVHGEVDFFVLIPETGIFALEVKGGRVRREQGIWSFTDKYGHTDTSCRGPFDQAWEGIYSIRKSLTEKLDKQHTYLNKIFFGIGVMFPDITYDSVGIDEEQWQVFDEYDRDNVKDYMLRIAKGSVKGWENQYGTVSHQNRPSVNDVKYLASVLRGDFDRVPSLRALYDYAEEDLIELTENQYRCIDQLEDNPRCLIRGAAGTGKTLLAVEQVKKAVSRGERVAFFCYNNLLSTWIRNYFKKQPEELRPVYAGSIHGYMLSVLKTTGYAIPEEDRNNPEYYDLILPSYATREMQCVREKFDRIIIDETQDIMSAPFLEFIDSCLINGLSHGRWTFFGDFVKQAIYDKGFSENDFIEYLDERTGFIRYKLTLNCRNTRYICEEIKTVTGFDKTIQYEGAATGPQVEYFTYKDRTDEKQKLISLLERLGKNSVEKSRITVLSPYKRENSVVNMLEGIHIQNYSIPETDEITFSTIHGFKGMENTVIVLCDIETLADTKLMYVAFSRASSGLYVLESEVASNEYTNLFIRRNFTK